MLFSTSLFELTRQERAVTALFGRVHVNRFLKGNYFSRLNVINLNSPLGKSLPIINTAQVAMLISEGILSRWHISRGAALPQWSWHGKLEASWPRHLQGERGHHSLAFGWPLLPNLHEVMGIFVLESSDPLPKHPPRLGHFSLYLTYVSSTAH